jgi:hypothetical protein
MAGHFTFARTVKMMSKQKIIPKQKEAVHKKLSQIITAAPLTATIYLCPDQRDADALIQIGFNALSIKDVSPALAPTYLKDRHVCIVDPDRQAENKVATALDGNAASVRVINLDGSDVVGWLVNDRAGAQLATATRKAPVWVPKVPVIGTSTVTGTPPAGTPPASGRSEEEELVAALATLPLMDYARRKKKIAKSLGITTIELDRMVAKERKESAGRAFVLYDHWRVEACDQPVDGNDLVAALVKLLRQYVIITEDQSVVIALWIILTYVHEDIATHSPLLVAEDRWLLGAPWCVER